MKGFFSKTPRPTTATGRPCRECGLPVERLPNGTPYNDNGTFHNQKNGTCKPSDEWQKKEKLRRAEWEAKNLINGEDRREIRSQSPLCRRGRK